MRKRRICIYSTVKDSSRQDAMALDQEKIRKTIRKLRKSLERNSQWRSPEKVHDLRTRSRRFEAVMRALMFDQKPSGDRLLKTVAWIFKQAGKVRDMDVLTAFVSGLTIEGPAAHSDAHNDSCVAQLLQHLQEQRQKSALKLHARIGKHGKPVRHQLQQCFTHLPGKGEAADLDQLHANATAFALQLAGELAAWPHLTVANMHPYRLKVKELRYTLQMAEGDDTPFVSMLEEITDAIGEWHDWSTLQEIATEVFKRHLGCAVAKAIRSTALAKRHDALLLANTMRKKSLGTVSRTLKQPRKTIFSKTALAAIATLASPQSKH